MRPDNFNLNKKSVKSFIKSILNGDFWFGDDKLNIADRKITRGTDDKKTSETSSLMPNFFPRQDSGQESILKIENDSMSIVEYKQVAIKREGATPNGYIKLFLKDIDTNQLFLKHNITLKFLDIEGDKYVKSFILGNEDREIDCYSLGENESLTISKQNSSIINIILKEISGKQESLTIVNGIVVY